ncbi:MAG: ABC transporter ATP-binding protein/permease [Lachnospiraceae bacterium]|nr:ABC transporter ATP-binding protein/permease [Lachnospiraceae bacterium]MDE7000948.1 ABC transporter ATP-binding protein/permease [Lachnospiraceae bacterium]
MVWRNNWFLIKLMFSASPSFMIFTLMDSIRNQISIFFEHTYGIGYVLEAAEFHYPFRQVAQFILILAGCITLGMVFTVVAGDYIQEKERPKVREKIKMLLYEKTKELDLACYDNPEYYNEMVLAISEVDTQIDRCEAFLRNTASGITVFVSTGIYFLIRDRFSIVFAASSFVMAFAFNQLYNKRSFQIRMERNPHERKREYVKRVFYLGDYAKEIRLNPEIPDILLQTFEQANEEVYRVEKKHAMRRLFLGVMRRYVSNDFFSDVLYITYLVFQAAVRGVLSFSGVAILYNSFGRLKRGMSIFTDVYPFACESSLYVQKIRDFLAYEPKIQSEESIEPAEGAREMELDGVSFAYDQRTGGLLRDISLHIAPGEKIALVGYNGAGKTTLVKLLMRLYDVDAGRILADGRDIRTYDVQKYRDSIGTVFQDFQIFAGSVRENVLLDVADGCGEDGIKEALADSGLMERVERMEKGIDTPLTTEFMEDGMDLSGGESQKLAIARVFYRKAGLMILDEPSSALDPIAEYQLNHAMLSATKDKTVIFISHRLSTTRLADRIIMLEQGRIVEQGSHSELLERDGKYAQMWRVQAGAYIEV